MLEFQFLFRRFYQLPAKHTRKIIKVYPPLTPRRAALPTIVKNISNKYLDDVLDPQSEKRNLLRTLKAGDVIRISSKNTYNNFIGYILAINRSNILEDTTVLLRNQIAKNYININLPIFSPEIERIDVVQRQKLKLKNGRKPRRHSFIQDTKIDTGSIVWKK